MRLSMPIFDPVRPSTHLRIVAAPVAAFRDRERLTDVANESQYAAQRLR